MLQMLMNVAPAQTSTEVQMSVQASLQSASLVLGTLTRQCCATANQYTERTLILQAENHCLLTLHVFLEKDSVIEVGIFSTSINLSEIQTVTLITSKLLYTLLTQLPAKIKNLTHSPYKINI